MNAVISYGAGILKEPNASKGGFTLGPLSGWLTSWFTTTFLLQSLRLHCHLV